MSKLTREDLEKLCRQPESEKSSISIGLSACGLAAGAEEVYKVLVEEIQKRHLAVDVNKCGCIGMCYAEPLVEVKVAGMPTVTYGRVNKDVAMRIIERHIVGKMLLNDSIFEPRI